MESLTGKTIRWVFDEGPMAGVHIEHVFDADGSVTWRMADGPDQGASRREISYGAAKLNAETWIVSYLAASGHTLTVALSMTDGHAIGFASDNTSWSQARGRFEILP